MDQFLRDMPMSAKFWWMSINCAHLCLMLVLVVGESAAAPAILFGVVAYGLGWIGQDFEQTEQDAKWMADLRKQGDDDVR